MAHRTYTVSLRVGCRGGGLGRDQRRRAGLATGADTLDGLMQKLKVVIPELLDANGLLSADDSGEIPFAIIAERHELAPRAA